MKIKLSPHLNSFIEVSFFKDRQTYVETIKKLRGGKIADTEDSCSWMNFSENGDKQGEMFFCNCSDRGIVFNVSGFATEYCVWMMNGPFKKLFADKTEEERMTILCANIPAFSEFLFEQIIEARNKEFFVPQ